MAELTFGILGPLAAWCGDTHVRLPWPRERVLLAALLVNHGQVVPVDRLVQALWDEGPPPTARRQVAICVSRLRAAFAEVGAGKEVITTCPPGYRAGGLLDARRFEDYASQAHRARDAGRPAEAVRLLRAGLSLWRGPALGGIDRPFAEIEAARLEERRIALTGERVDLELELGRHEEVIAELRALLAADPLRERLRAQLMLALYRAGRRAESLEVYRSGRRLLTESLGMEPGPELQRLHQAVLRDDPALAPPAEAPAPWAPPPAGAPWVPAQLPPPVAAFTGRAAQFAALDELADAGSAGGGEDRPLSVAVITGVAGVGKTGLAVQWSHLAARRFPGGQLFADLRGYDAGEEPLRPGAVLDRFLRALGVPGQQIPAALDERTALLRTVLNGRRVLIVLDNAREPAQVRPLLPGSGTCMVLITSRDRLGGLVAHDGARPVDLDVLGGDEAAAMLDRMCGGLADPASTARLAALCGRLPLALRIAGARLCAHPSQSVSDLAELLADERRRLHELSDGDWGVRASFRLSYRELPGPAAGLLRHLGLIEAADFAAWTAAALLGVAEREAGDVLARLVRAGLVEPAGTDQAGQPRYRLHDLMRLFAREQSVAIDPPEVRSGVAQRMLGAALDLAEQADKALGNPFVVPLYGKSARYRLEGQTLDRVLAAPVAWLEAERAVLTGAVAQACRLGLGGHAWELTCALSQFLSTARHLDDWRECARRSAAVARAVGDARGEAAVLLQLADLQADTGRYQEAARSTSRALSLAERSGDTEAAAVCWTFMAVVHRERGEATLAQRDAGHALALLGGSGADAARGRALTVLGLSYLDQGRHAAAADCFTRFLRIQQRTRSVRGLAEARYRLGTARLHQGSYAAAVRLLAVAMRSATQAGDLMTAMTARVRLGQAYLQAGQLDRARPLLEHALRYLSAEDSPRFRALALDALGRLHQARDEPGQAGPLLAEARLLQGMLSQP